MNSFSWAKLVFIAVLLSAVRLTVPPVENVANNQMAMQQMEASNDAYVKHQVWNNSGEKAGIAYSLVVIFGIIVMLPELRRLGSAIRSEISEETT